MKDNFRLIISIKRLISYLDKIIVNFPNNEKVLKDKINNTLYDILELTYLANELNDRKTLQKRIIVKIKMLDFYFKVSCDKKYLSYKKYSKVSNHLLNILKGLYGWIRYEKI